MGTTYSDQDQARALTAYTEHGPAKAEELTGISRRTISRWATLAGLVPTSQRVKTTEARATNATRVANAWGDFREQEALAAGSAAVAARGRLRDLLAGRVRVKNPEADEPTVILELDAAVIRAVSVAYGILIDKAELLSGQATERIELWSETEIDAELREAMTMMEDRIRSQEKESGENDQPSERPSTDPPEEYEADSR